MKNDSLGDRMKMYENIFIDGKTGKRFRVGVRETRVGGKWYIEGKQYESTSNQM